MKKPLWKIKYLFYRYILGHRYTMGVDINSQDDVYSVIVRRDKRGVAHVETMDKKHNCKENLIIGKWKVEGFKAYLKCKKCGWFETNLFKADVQPRTQYKP